MDIPTKIPGKAPESDEKRQFDALINAVEIPEGDKKDIVYFKYTHLPSVDRVILQAQETINEIHKVRYGLIKGMEKILNKTGVCKLAGANTSHAILAMIYAMAAQTKGAASEDLITFGTKFPYFKFGKDSSTVNIAKDVKILAEYFYCLEKAYEKMPKLVDDCTELAKKSATLQDDAAGDLERVDKISLPSVMSALTHDANMLKKAVIVATNTMNLGKLST